MRSVTKPATVVVKLGRMQKNAARECIHIFFFLGGTDFCQRFYFYPPSHACCCASCVLVCTKLDLSRLRHIHTIVAKCKQKTERQKSERDRDNLHMCNYKFPDNRTLMTWAKWHFFLLLLLLLLFLLSLLVC